MWRFLLVLQDRALNYLSICIDQVTSFGDILQLVIVELIYKVSVAVCSCAHSPDYMPVDNVCENVACIATSEILLQF